MNITEASKIMKDYSDILKTLVSENVVRTFNSPVGDYAEWLVAQTFNLTLCRNSETGYDATDAAGVRYQVKSRWDNSGTQKSFSFNVIRDLDKGDPFDYLIAVIFNPDFSVKMAYKISIDDVRQKAKYNKHQNGHVLTISTVHPAFSDDITNQF